MDKKEAQRKIRKAAREGWVERAPAEGIDAFAEEAREFLAEVLKHPEALITDWSDIGDFISGGKAGYEAKKEEIWSRIERLYKVDVRPEINILKILRLIHSPKGTA